MKILITGCAGFIGKFLLYRFARDGHEVIGLYRKAVPTSSSPNTRFIRCDLDRPLIDLERVDLVIHTAAAHVGSQSANSPESYLKSNGFGALHLAHYLAAKPPSLLIHLSTLSIYGAVLEPELKENTTLNHPEIYGATKYLAEIIFKEISPCPTVHIRLPGVVGKDSLTSWVGRALKKALANEPIAIYNPASLFNNVIDVEEIYQFTCALSKKVVKKNDAVHLATRHPIPIRDVILKIIALSDSHSPIIEEDQLKRSFTISIQKLMDDYCYYPKSTVETIEHFIQINTPLYQRNL